MDPSIWSHGIGVAFRDEDHVHDSFFAEVAARLVVLKHMLQQLGKDLTPLHWLHFIMSESGNYRVCKVYEAFMHEHLIIDKFIAKDLLGHVSDKLMELYGNNDPKSVPVLVVDELQALGNRKVTGVGEQISVMRAVVNAVCSLDIAAIWSGTRMTVASAISETSAFGKPLIGQRKLKIVGDYEYLQPNKVEELLEKVLDLSYLSSHVKHQLFYGLQGRGRQCAGFVAFLLSPDIVSKVGENLTDTILDVFESYMNTEVTNRVIEDVSALMKLNNGNRMGHRDVGVLWCHTMLPVIKSPVYEADRLNCIAFTKCVVEMTPGGEVTASSSTINGGMMEVTADLNTSVPNYSKYKYEYVFGEPSLQAALLNYVRNKPTLVDQGIAAFLQNAWHGAVLGIYLDYTVALSLLNKKMVDLVKDTSFEMFSNYTLSLSRVVVITTVEQQLEWFSLVLEDPDNCTFSLLPGVPVKNIIIMPSTLSGADVICVAVLNGSMDQPYIDKIGKRKYFEDIEKKQIVFLHVCCATYEKTVTQVKHKDNKCKMGNQFVCLKRKCFAADRYREMAIEYAENYDVIPILVEIPQLKPEVCDEYILITNEHNATKLFSEDVSNIFGRFTENKLVK